mgnify:CR=1 FL=1
MTKRSSPRSQNATARTKKPVLRKASTATTSAAETLTRKDFGADSFDASGLARAKSSWYFGDWDALSEIQLATFNQHPDRGLLALLVGSAHQQLGNHDAARRYVTQAMSWGCDKQVVAQILVAGVHNTLGRAAALAKNDTKMVKHFSKAISVGVQGGEGASVRQVRSLREMARLELLPQAAALLGDELAKTRDLSARPEETRARVKVLETELELLTHELSIAQQRQQLFRPTTSTTDGSQEIVDVYGHRELQGRSVSQLGQDLWVLEQTGFKRGGFFVEFGATDGVLLSNTYLLEKEFGWRGICAEPNPKFFDRLKEHRKCTVSDACIGGQTGREVEFVFADAYGGIADYKDSDHHAEKRAAYIAAGQTANLKTIALHDFLKQHNAPREIDYLSIDTEGSELEILSTFPFGEWNIKLITVEHNFTPQRQMIRELLLAQGYRCTEREWDDWYALS